MKQKEPRILIDSSSPQERRSFLRKLAGVVAGTAALGGFTNLFAKKTYSGTELSAFASPEPYLGSISMVGFNYAPRGWALCFGQLIAISQNTALYSLLGSRFGGDDRTVFRIPDLRGRVPMGFGDGPGLTPRVLGQMPGTEIHTLTMQQMPVHDHTTTFTPPVYSASGVVTPGAFSGRGGTASNDPINNFPAPAPAGTNIYNSSSNQVMGESPVTVEISEGIGGSVTVNNSGGSSPFSITQPSTCVNFIIATEGIFPPRN